MATLHHDHTGHGFAYLKGAPEKILTMCHLQRMRGEDVALDRGHWDATMEQMASRGQRLLAIAFKAMPKEQQSLAFADVEYGLTLLGVVGIIDPPREEAIAAVEACRYAGIDVKMITASSGHTPRLQS